MNSEIHVMAYETKNSHTFYSISEYKFNTRDRPCQAIMCVCTNFI